MILAIYVDIPKTAKQAADDREGDRGACGANIEARGTLLKEALSVFNHIHHKQYNEHNNKDDSYGTPFVCFCFLLFFR